MSGARPAALLILGSPHKTGATAALLRAFLEREGMGLEGHSLFDAYQTRPLPCVDCGYCKVHNGCALPDLQDFYREFEQAQLLVIASPVYNAGLPAPLKAAVDRTQVYYNARFSRGIRPPIALPKRAVLLLTAGADRDYRPLILEQLSPMFTVTNCKLHGAACLRDLDGHPADARRIAEALADVPPLRT